jgi:mono/diheme cytochrome c family protein
MQFSNLLFRLSLFTLALALALSLASVVPAATLQQDASQGQALFAQKCQACHTIGGGRLVGPDLQGVVQRRDLAWLKQFIAAPESLLYTGDPLAAQLLAESNNVPMPNLGLSEADIDSLIAYLENPDAAGQGGAAPVAPAAPQPGDPQRGLALFSGQAGLQNGGQNCMACHSAAGLPSLGGGSLGPELTGVVTRYGSEAGMAGVLAGLPFPTMQGIFASAPLTAQEQADLLAYFVWAGTQPAPVETAAGQLNTQAGWFLGIAAAGALALFAVMLLAWPRQKTSISERLRSK